MTISKVIIIVAKNIKTSPAKKAKSAMVSYFFASDEIELRIERKDKIQLIIKLTIVTAVNSSMYVVAFSFNNFNEVSTTKQIPRRLEEAFKICGDFSFFIK